MSRAADLLNRVPLGAWISLAGFAALFVLAVAFVAGFALGRPPAPEPGGAPAPAADGTPVMYTCSMHPSVRLPDPDAKCPICFMDLIPVTTSSGEDPTRLVLSADAARRSRIETVPVGRFLPTAEVRLYGRLAEDETSVARLTAYFPGRIERLFVNYVGVPVAKGDHLAEMYSPMLLAAFDELRQARLAVDGSTTSSEIVREATTRTLEAARERLRLLGVTEAQVAAAESGASAGERLTVYAPIAGIVTHMAVREGDYVETGSPIATVADLSRLWLDLAAYESQLPLLRWGQPVTFTVEAHPGETFAGRIAFIEPIVDDRTRTAAVRVAVDNTERRLKPGMFASATVRMRVASGGAVVSDELAGRWVCPMHPTVVEDAAGPCPICGMDLVPAESLGIVGDPTTIEVPLVVPRTAALVTGRRAVVYVAVPDADEPTYEGREVVLGPRAGDFVIVESGLREGEDVVVHGAFRVDSAMQIEAKPSMMMPGGGGGGGHGHGDAMPDAMNAPADHVPEAFVHDLKPVYAAYLDAQTALAEDDLGAFHVAADDLRIAVDLVDPVGLVGEPLGAWRRAAARLRLGEPVTAIDAARARFESMSTAILDVERRFGHHGAETWYRAFCPMAFENRGAEWMQRGTRIRNPWFGASMLRCGEIRGEFPPRDGEGRP